MQHSYVDVTPRDVTEEEHRGTVRNGPMGTVRHSHKGILRDNGTDPRGHLGTRKWFSRGTLEHSLNGTIKGTEMQLCGDSGAQ